MEVKKEGKVTRTQGRASHGCATQILLGNLVNEMKGGGIKRKAKKSHKMKKSRKAKKTLKNKKRRKTKSMRKRKY